MSSTSPPRHEGNSESAPSAPSRRRPPVLTAALVAVLAATTAPAVWVLTRDGVVFREASAGRPAPAVFTPAPDASDPDPSGSGADSGTPGHGTADSGSSDSGGPGSGAAKETSLWRPDVPVRAGTHSDRAPVELGTRFTAARGGWATGVRFYKARGEQGEHTGNLWDARGRRLARVTFEDETASGWQEARFASPVRLAAGRTYTVSYHSTHGTYVGTSGSRPARSGPLATTPHDAGVFGYGSSAFPRRSNPKRYNYWVDVVFRWRPQTGEQRDTGSSTPRPFPGKTTPPPDRGGWEDRGYWPDQIPWDGETAWPGDDPWPDEGRGPDDDRSSGEARRPGGDRWPGEGRGPGRGRWPGKDRWPGATPSPSPDPGGTATSSPGDGSEAPGDGGTPRPTPTGKGSDGPDDTPGTGGTGGPTLTPKPVPPRDPEPVPDGRVCAGHPTPACTGVPPGAKLRTLALNEDSAAYLVTARGTVLDGVRVPGDLVINADDVTVRNSRIDGRVINADGDRTFRFTITDSTIGPASGCQTLPGIGQDKYTALRVHVRGHGDGFRASGDDVTIRDSYVNLCSNPGDHSDGIQTYNTGKNLTFHHNTVDQRHAKDITAPIFLTDDQIMNATVTDNLIMGGTYSIQLKNARGRLVVHDNRLVDRSWVYGPVEADCAKIDWSGNSLVTIDQNYRVTSTVAPLPCSG
ncbi:DUF4082 domain-containing protein [Streptosporangium sandarakinum]|uniref:DUF4082 domain-containing protein n=1 Tax=Streptosporangium sandarakinum TaxID=1260955 RepID=UPI0037AE8F53